MSAWWRINVFIVVAFISLAFGILSYIQFLQILSIDRNGNYQAQSVANSIRFYKQQGYEPKVCVDPISPNIIVYKEKDCNNGLILSKYNGETPYSQRFERLEMIEDCSKSKAYRTNMIINYENSLVVFCAGASEENSYSFN